MLWQQWSRWLRYWAERRSLLPLRLHDQRWRHIRPATQRWQLGQSRHCVRARWNLGRWRPTAARSNIGHRWHNYRDLPVWAVCWRQTTHTKCEHRWRGYRESMDAKWWPQSTGDKKRAAIRDPTSPKTSIHRVTVDTPQVMRAVRWLGYTWLMARILIPNIRVPRRQASLLVFEIRPNARGRNRVTVVYPRTQWARVGQVPYYRPIGRENYTRWH